MKRLVALFLHGPFFLKGGAGRPYWLAHRPATPPTVHPPRRDPTAPTLYDPHRLQTALSLFTESTSAPGAPFGSTHTNRETRMRTETLCRLLLEAMLGFPLPKQRPRWLVNPTTKRCLELDMYNEERSLAFEFDGAQHEVYTPHFHGSPDQFQYRKLLDRLKNELCHEHGVRLIRIPFHEVSVSDEGKTTMYLQRLLRIHGIPFVALLPDVTA